MMMYGTAGAALGGVAAFAGGKLGTSLLADKLGESKAKAVGKLAAGALVATAALVTGILPVPVAVMIGVASLIA